ncbi:MAG: DUF4331 family protein [Thermodesulfobacteriota bacterium]
MYSLNLRSFFTLLFVISFSFSSLLITQKAFGADHVEAPIAVANPELDITDVYAFIDPQDDSQIVVAMAVNPFLPPEDGSTGFSPDVLYQFKFDNTGDGVEDYVVQFQFTGTGANQTVQVFAANVTESVNTPLGGTPVATGNTQEIITSGNFRVFAGFNDDAFVFDFGQFTAILDGTQDVFRGFTSPILGELRGRNAGASVDLFSGVNATHMVVSFPKSIVDNGTGFFDGLAGTNIVGVWGTTSRDGVQLERMGQQVINTVFVPSGMKDAFNAATPAEDVAMFSSLIPDALTQVDTDGTGNTIDGRIAVLQLSGLVGTPNGAPLLLPEGFEHPLGLGAALLRIALLPDVIRLDLNRAADDQSIGLFALQNGRRPQDDIIDIGLQLLRQLADVKFPDGAMVPVEGGMIPVPGSGPVGERATLDCGNPEFPQCSDRRVLVVLQGTDFTTPDAQIDALNYTTSGNDSGFAASGSSIAQFMPETTSPNFNNTVFPFMAVAQQAPDGGSDSGCSLASTGNKSKAALASLLPALIFGFVFGRMLIRRKK